LLHAIGNHLLNQSKNISIKYYSCKTFIEILIDENRLGDLRIFIKLFHYILLDDVQQLLLLKFAQEVLLEVIKDFVCSGKQIILTSDCPLQMLPNLIFDSFNSGTIIQLYELDMEAKSSFLKNKVKENKIRISDCFLQELFPESCK
jgi:chromosomal replication initiator protein